MTPEETNTIRTIARERIAAGVGRMRVQRAAQVLAAASTQINFVVPAATAVLVAHMGRREVAIRLTMDRKAANPVTVNIQ